MYILHGQNNYLILNYLCANFVTPKLIFTSMSISLHTNEEPETYKYPTLPVAYFYFNLSPLYQSPTG